MAFVDEQIDRLLTGLHSIVAELDDVLTKKIGEIRELLNGVSTTTTLNVAQVKPAEKP